MYHDLCNQELSKTDPNLTLMVEYLMGLDHMKNLKQVV